GDSISTTRYAAALNFGAITGYVAHADGAAFTIAEVAARLAPGASDRTITTQYDALNRATLVTEPAAFTFDSSAAAGSPAYFAVGRSTRNRSNPFGQVIRQSVLKNPGADGSVGTADDTWLDAYLYYDVRGNKTAQVDALGYLTLWEYDAAGNTTRQAQYAQALAAGTWSVSGYGAPVATTPDSSPGSAIGYDREVRYQYDLKNQKIAETQVNVEYDTFMYDPLTNALQYDPITGTPTLATTHGDLTTSYDYDALGNVILVRSPNPTGGTAATTYTYYDALGRVVAKADPARVNDGAQGTVSMPPVYASYDTASNTTTIRFARSAPSGTNVAFGYRVAGSNAQWTPVNLPGQGGGIIGAILAIVQGNDFVASVSGLASDTYEYQIIYTRNGETAAYATGNGRFTAIGASNTGSNAAAAGQQPNPPSRS